MIILCYKGEEDIDRITRLLNGYMKIIELNKIETDIGLAKKVISKFNKLVKMVYEL